MESIAKVSDRLGASSGCTWDVLGHPWEVLGRPREVYVRLGVLGAQLGFSKNLNYQQNNYFITFVGVSDGGAREFD
jgi:hypothetical protein